MSTYSESNFDTQHYNLARPSYPEEFYKTLMNYHNSTNSACDLALDIGCGSGFVAFKLLDFFNKVIGTDVSSTMISQCRKTTKPNQNIQFLEGAAEHSPPEIQENSVDLITGAECCHWVDHDKFFKESFRILKPGGTLAYWFYKDPIFVGYDKANEIYTNYTYNSSLESDKDGTFERYMGPYYQQPGHDYLRTLLKEIEVPTKYFKDIVRHEYDPEYEGADPTKTTLYISKKITLPVFLNYVKSWSAYHSWMKEHGAKYDVAEAFVEELKQAMGWDDSFEFEVVWATVYTFAKKK
mmetsp:Transcript_7747/g.7682  ORF Transcript_7747/g.7682 Transcript_7747/m.7682 type:complete len:295 (-) Transcript_7747:1375-2259(-)